MKTERIVSAHGLEGYRVTDGGKLIGKRNCQLVGCLSNGYTRYTVRVNKKTKSINGDRSDNRLSNLRVVTHKENMANPVTRARMGKPRKHYSVKYEKV